MNLIGRQTRKLYYEDPQRSRCEATVVRSGPDYVELDRTVAYPEGGGQESDCGLLHLADGRSIRFVGAKRMYGHAPRLEGFPDIEVEGVIWHLVHPDDRPLAASVQPGEPVAVEIDVERRARLSLSHTGSHLLYLGIARHRPDALPGILGCHIKPEGARFDFSVAERFVPDEVEAIVEYANDFVRRAAPIWIEAHPEHPDARVWCCEAHRIPCGGTHLSSAAPVGLLRARRKCLGAGKERLSCEFPEARIALTAYHIGDGSAGAA